MIYWIYGFFNFFIITLSDPGDNDDDGNINNNMHSYYVDFILYK